MAEGSQIQAPGPGYTKSNVQPVIPPKMSIVVRMNNSVSHNKVTSLIDQSYDNPKKNQTPTKKIDMIVNPKFTIATKNHNTKEIELHTKLNIYTGIVQSGQSKKNNMSRGTLKINGTNKSNGQISHRNCTSVWDIILLLISLFKLL